jgi:hypothetical protein
MSLPRQANMPLSADTCWWRANFGRYPPPWRSTRQPECSAAWWTVVTISKFLTRRRWPVSVSAGQARWVMVAGAGASSSQSTSSVPEVFDSGTTSPAPVGCLPRAFGCRQMPRSPNRRWCPRTCPVPGPQRSRWPGRQSSAAGPRGDQSPTKIHSPRDEVPWPTRRQHQYRGDADRRQPIEGSHRTLPPGHVIGW